MKAKPIIIISLVSVIVLVVIGAIVLAIVNPWKSSVNQQTQQNQQSMNDSDRAIARVKAEYPELSDYPSDLLPPKSIRYAQVNDTWYVAFIQEGSGVPIISAKCFTVDGSGVVILFREYTPQSGDVTTNPFSPISCKPL